jgi:hypothetical protein
MVKRLNQNRELFEAAPGETITVTVEASKTPFQVTFSGLGSGQKWASSSGPTPGNSVQIKEFIMPGNPREFFDIVYAFPPSGQADPGAKYFVSFSGGGGTSDGPIDVFPPFVGDICDLFYEFRLPETKPGTAAAIMKAFDDAAPRKAPKKAPAKTRRRGKGR